MIGLIDFLILYANNIVLAKTIEYIDKTLTELKHLCNIYELTIKFDKTKIMIIKSRKIIYLLILYSDNTLKEV
jgi:hypothetical protein